MPPRCAVGNTVAMQNRWSDAEATRHASPLAARVYTSRLLGVDPDLVMHGGGNTSVKVVEPDLFGNPVDVLYVKGSGSDLSTVTEQGFAPVRLEHLLRLAELDELTDAHMAEQLRLACVRADSPAPSVEAVLHAILPARYVDHTHADAVLSITNTPNGRKLIEELYGDRVVVVDYVMPGFALGAEVRARVPRAADRRHRRHGVDAPRDLHVRRVGPRVVRPDDRARRDGRGLSREAGCVRAGHCRRRRRAL